MIIFYFFFGVEFINLDDFRDYWVFKMSEVG